MTRNIVLATLSAILISFAPRFALGADMYVAGSVGVMSNEVELDSEAVSHPTRCDRLLYVNPAQAPMDAVCLSNTKARIFGDSFELNNALAGSASIGYDWGRVRVEAELNIKSGASEKRPAIPDLNNAAVLTKTSEWSTESPPYLSISEFRIHRLFLNLHYKFSESTVWQPYIGIGAGIARVRMDLGSSFLRRTANDGYIEAVGGNPMQPADWQLAAAGSLTLLEAEISDDVFGYQLLAGVERDLGNRTSAFLTFHWSKYGDFSSEDLWATVRSHAPVRADGMTPFTSEQSFRGLGGLGAALGIRYFF